MLSSAFFLYEPIYYFEHSELLFNKRIYCRDRDLIDVRTCDWFVLVSLCVCAENRRFMYIPIEILIEKSNNKNKQATEI